MKQAIAKFRNGAWIIYVHAANSRVRGRYGKPVKTRTVGGMGDKSGAVGWLSDMAGELDKRCSKTPEIDELAGMRRFLVDTGRILAALYDEAHDGGGGSETGWGVDIQLLYGSYTERVREIEKTVASGEYHDKVADYLLGLSKRSDVSGGTMVWWRYHGRPQGDHAEAYAIALAGYTKSPCRWTKMHIPIGTESLLIYGPEWLYHSMVENEWGWTGTSEAFTLSESEGDYLCSINSHGRGWESTVRAAIALDARRADSRTRRDAVS